MPTARFRYSIGIATGPRAREFAQPFVAPELELTGDPAEYQVAVAPATIVTLWDSTTSPVASFLLLILRSDLEVDVEFTASGTAMANRVDTKTLQAGSIPFILGSDRTRAADGALALNETNVGRITKIRAYNKHATDTAYVQVVIGA